MRRRSPRRIGAGRHSPSIRLQPTLPASPTAIAGTTLGRLNPSPPTGSARMTKTPSPAAASFARCAAQAVTGAVRTSSAASSPIMVTETNSRASSPALSTGAAPSSRASPASPVLRQMAATAGTR